MLRYAMLRYATLCYLAEEEVGAVTAPAAAVGPFFAHIPSLRRPLSDPSSGLREMGRGHHRGEGGYKWGGDNLRGGGAIRGGGGDMTGFFI